MFFFLIAIGNFFEKNENFWQFFLNVKFLAIFWHSNGNFPEGQLPTMPFFSNLNKMYNMFLLAIFEGSSWYKGYFLLSTYNAISWI